MRQRYFSELLIVLSKFSLSELFHLRLHLFFNLSECDCQMAEMLSGKHLWSSAGRDLASLDWPWAASLASSSVRLFSLKFRCLGTQWSWRLITPLFPIFPLFSGIHYLQMFGLIDDPILFRMETFSCLVDCIEDVLTWVCALVTQGSDDSLTVRVKDSQMC